MWGEIEPVVKLQPSSSEGDDQSKSREESLTEFRGRTEEPQLPPQDTRDVSSGVSAMLEAIALSDGKVKSQQMGEAELTPGERREELLRQYRTKPLVFLERYHTFMKPQHLSSFAHVSSDPRAEHYSKVIQRRAAGCNNRTAVRNQRYAALRALQKDGREFHNLGAVQGKVLAPIVVSEIFGWISNPAFDESKEYHEGQYFSDEQMRQREPLLYEQYIGQYLTDEAVLQQSQEAILEGAQGGPGSPGGEGGLAHLLLNSYQEHLIQYRLQEEQEREEGAQEEEDEEDKDDVQEEAWEPTSEMKALLREEFISQMHQRFLDGKDKDFNYREVDENPDHDNLDIVSRDEEEKYFDEDDEEEEETMTE